MGCVDRCVVHYPLAMILVRRYFPFYNKMQKRQGARGNYTVSITSFLVIFKYQQDGEKESEKI